MIRLTYRDVADEVEAAVAAGRPYSLVRLGDGENSVLRYPDRVRERRIQRVMSRALEDRVYSPDEILDVRRGMIEAANGSDVVGCYSSSEPNEHCALFQDDLAYAGVTVGKVCQPAVHYYLAASGCVSRIVAAADYVTLVTGRDIKARFDRRHGTDVEQVLLPSERMFRLREEGDRSPHYPDIYHSILGGMKVRSGRHLFLVGGGILAKAYCHAARRAGAIAVDIGSVFDYWAGIPSREDRLPIVDGVLVHEESWRRGLGLDNEPLSDAELKDAHPEGFGPPLVSACARENRVWDHRGRRWVSLAALADLGGPVPT